MSAQRASHEAAAGAWAGLVGTVLGYPLDVVKSRMQTGHAGVKDVPGRATFVATLGRLFLREGVSGAYRGLGPPVCMMMLMNAVNFTAFNRAKDALGVQGPLGFDPEGVKGEKTFRVEWRVVAAATSVGPLCALIGTPFELVKLQMQMETARTNAAARTNTTGVKSSSLNAVKHKNDKNVGALRFAQRLHSKYGWRVFYLGGSINVVRECLFNAVFFSTYEHVHAFGLRRSSGSSLRDMSTDSVSIATAGGLAGAAAWLANLPLDCVKSVVQGQDLRNGGWDVEKRLGRVGFNDAASSVLQTRGAFGFFSGAAPSISRSFIVSGSRFVAFAGAMRALEGDPSS
jgi:solute carrier family 25 carnitine/acylcarnitine transporter 20/29